MSLFSPLCISSGISGFLHQFTGAKSEDHLQRTQRQYRDANPRLLKRLSPTVLRAGLGLAKVSCLKRITNNFDTTPLKPPLCCPLLLHRLVQHRCLADV